MKVRVRRKGTQGRAWDDKINIWIDCNRHGVAWVTECETVMQGIQQINKILSKNEFKTRPGEIVRRPNQEHCESIKIPSVTFWITRREE